MYMGKRQWWVLFTYILDLSVIIAGKLQLSTDDENINQLQFLFDYMRKTGEWVWKSLGSLENTKQFLLRLES